MKVWIANFATIGFVESVNDDRDYTTLDEASSPLFCTVSASPPVLGQGWLKKVQDAAYDEAFYIEERAESPDEGWDEIPETEWRVIDNPSPQPRKVIEYGLATKTDPLDGSAGFHACICIIETETEE